MRRSILASTLILSACATAPQQPAAPVQTPEIIATPQTARSGLVGLSAQDLVGKFGNPALQVREGTSLKLQFRSRACVLDAYLYPSTGGTLRVTHIDTRAASGADTDQAACISALETPS